MQRSKRFRVPPSPLPAAPLGDQEGEGQFYALLEPEEEKLDPLKMALELHRAPVAP